MNGTYKNIEAAIFLLDPSCKLGNGLGLLDIELVEDDVVQALIVEGKASLGASRRVTGGEDDRKAILGKQTDYSEANTTVTSGDNSEVCEVPCST